MSPGDSFHSDHCILIIEVWMEKPKRKMILMGLGFFANCQIKNIPSTMPLGSNLNFHNILYNFFQEYST
jgi:hypothetical protein